MAKRLLVAQKTAESVSVPHPNLTKQFQKRYSVDMNYTLIIEHACEGEGNWYWCWQEWSYGEQTICYLDGKTVDGHAPTPQEAFRTAMIAYVALGGSVVAG